MEIKFIKGSVLLMLRSLTLWLVKKLCHLNQLLDWVEAVKHPHYPLSIQELNID